MVAIRQWSLQHEVAAIALANGRTVAEAAAEAFKAERTIHYWLEDEYFAGRVEDLREQIALGVREEGLRLAIADKTRRLERLDEAWTQAGLIRLAIVDALRGRPEPGGGQSDHNPFRLLNKKELLEQLLKVMREERAISDVAADELGQKVKKFAIEDLSDEMIARLLNEIAAQEESRPGQETEGGAA
jgi:hypothetical protein